MRKLIREKQLSKINVNEICEMAHISRRTFYRYYPDKYELFTVTYIVEFYNKLNIDDDTFIYDIYEKLVFQMYEEKEFFTHAIAIKGQNGFWKLLIDLILPHVLKNLSTAPYIDRAKEFYAKKDIEVTLHFIEEWINNGYSQTPEELFQFIRLCGALHGKWEYQSAMRHPIDKYSLEKFLNNEW
jgi:AcrR family transcriptional regulator